MDWIHLITPAGCDISAGGGRQGREPTRAEPPRGSPRPPARGDRLRPPRLGVALQLILAQPLMEAPYVVETCARLGLPLPGSVPCPKTASCDNRI